MSEKLSFVQIGKIKVSPRTRQNFGDMTALVESVRDKGIIQPITINSKFQLLAGERRYRAAKEVGLKILPCLIRDGSDPLDALEIELIENIHREDFTFDERADHIKKLNDYCKAKHIDWSNRKLAQSLDRSRRSVDQDLKLAETLQHFPELRKMKTRDEALKAIKKMEEGVIVEELRRRQDTSSQRGLKDLLSVAKAGYGIYDTFKGMAEMRANGLIHFIELDPPYAIDLNTAKGGASQRGKGSKDSRAQTYNEIPVTQYRDWMTRMAKETYRVANSHAWMICWFGPTHFHLVKTALLDAGWKVNDIPAIWTKPSGQTAAPEFNLANCYEPFFICRKGGPVLTKRGRGNVFPAVHTPDKDKYHPTQRPIELMQDILETFTLPGQTCFVPCLGSGVTLRACYLHGLKGFGYDLSDEYLNRFLLAVEGDLEKLNKE